MPLPFTPADAKALIPSPSSSLCGNFLRSLLQLPVLFYQLINYLFDSSGNPTKQFGVLVTGDLEFSACTQSEDGSRLLCDGRDVLLADYPDLGAKLGSTYGTAAVGHFKIPDYTDKFPVGIGPDFAIVGVDGGEVEHTLTAAELPAHRHMIANTDTTAVIVDNLNSGNQLVKVAGSGVGSNQEYLLQGSNTDATVGRTSSIGAGTAHNNLPPYLGVYVYIRT